MRNFDAFFYACDRGRYPLWKRCPHEQDTTDIRHEGMRIGGETVFTDDVVEVRYPYTDEVVGTVPAGTRRTCKTRAFEIAANYKPKLTRYERSEILKRAGELIGERREDIWPSG